MVEVKVCGQHGEVVLSAPERGSTPVPDAALTEVLVLLTVTHSVCTRANRNLCPVSEHQPVFGLEAPPPSFPVVGLQQLPPPAALIRTTEEFWFCQRIKM